MLDADVVSFSETRHLVIGLGECSTLVGLVSDVKASKMIMYDFCCRAWLVDVTVWLFRVVQQFTGDRHCGRGSSSGFIASSEAQSKLEIGFENMLHFVFE